MRFSSFDHMLTHYAEVTPEAVALLYDSSGKKQCTYAGLLQAVKQQAEEYGRLGKRCLGVLSDGSFECIIAVFAANLAGMQIVMLDANAPLSRLKGSLPYADVDCLWGDSELCAELRPFLTDGPHGDYADQVLFFTSGTTSSPKAVTLTGKSLMNAAWNGSQKLSLAASDILLCMLPLGHVFGFVCGLLWGLNCGACVALGRGARHTMDDCLFYQPTALSAVPSLLGALAERSCLSKSLKLVLVGAGDCPPQLLSAVAEKGIRVCFGYGLTETSSGVAISIKGDPFAMEICPDDRIALAPDGEILIEAPTCMMRGYYKMPDETKEVLHDGILLTGDLGSFDEAGLLHITGRKKEILILHDGTKIFLPEYERMLAELLGISDVAVTLKEGRPVLVLHAPGRSDKEILGRIRPLMELLPAEQRISEAVLRSSPLPRTATGKLQRYRIHP